MTEVLTSSFFRINVATTPNYEPLPALNSFPLDVQNMIYMVFE